MSIISELPDRIDDSNVSLEGNAATAPAACAGCDRVGACRVAAGLARLARIRGKLVPSEHNVWLRDRIDEYLGLQVCLAEIFGVASSCLDSAPVSVMPGNSVTLEFALRRRGVRQ